MILSDGTITRLVEQGQIGIDPWDSSLVQPASIDVRLHGGFCWKGGLTVETDEHGGYLLKPGQFMLGSTLELVRIPDFLVGRLEGKSSLGRLALSVHATAGFIDPGFEGQITLEMFIAAGDDPVYLTPGQRIGQLSFMYLDRPALRPYGTPELGSHYQGQLGPTVSVLD